MIKKLIIKLLKMLGFDIDVKIVVASSIGPMGYTFEEFMETEGRLVINKSLGFHNSVNRFIVIIGSPRTFGEIMAMCANKNISPNMKNIEAIVKVIWEDSP